MEQNELERTAFLFAAKSMKDELSRMQEKAETKIRSAQFSGDVYGVLFYGARVKWLENLISFIDEEAKK